MPALGERLEQLHTQSVSDWFLQSVSESTGLFDSLSNTASVKESTSTRPLSQLHCQETLVSQSLNRFLSEINSSSSILFSQMAF